MEESRTVAKIKLPGGPEQTVSSVFVTEDGCVHFDFFDFSPTAQEHFGNDIAITIIVAPASRDLLTRALALPLGANPDAIVRACSDRFHHYFDAQPFLEQHSIPFDKHFDTHA